MRYQTPRIKVYGSSVSAITAGGGAKGGNTCMDAHQSASKPGEYSTGAYEVDE
jgi:hypothetical protein